MLAHALVLVVLGVGGLDDLDAVQVVLQAAVEVADGLADVGVAFLGQSHEPVREHGCKRDDRERDHGELAVEPEQNEGDADDEDAELDRLPEHVVEKALQAVGVVREDRHEFASLDLVEKLHVQPLHPLVRRGPDLMLDAVGEEVQRRRPDEVEDGLADHKHGHEGDHEPELIHRLVWEHRPWNQGQREGFAPEDSIERHAEKDRWDEGGEPGADRRQDSDKEPSATPVAVTLEQLPQRVFDRVTISFDVLDVHVIVCAHSGSERRPSLRAGPR